MEGRTRPSTKATGSQHLEVGCVKSGNDAKGSGEGPLQVRPSARRFTPANQSTVDDDEEEQGLGEAPGPVAPWRSTRVKCSTVVYSGNDAVRKSNVYDIDGGEPSIHDREQATDRGDMRYLGTKGFTLAPPQRNVPVSKPGGPSATKLYPPSHALRLSHNDSICKAAQEHVLARAVYLCGFANELKPFVRASVFQTIVDMAATATQNLQQPDPITHQSAGIRAILRQYQLEGVAWMVSKFHLGINGILADEMGLGKTLQTVAFLSYLKIELGISGPHLIVVPLSVMPSWMSEFEKWCPSLTVVRLHCSSDTERERMRKEVLSDLSLFDVVVTTYDTILSVKLGETLRNKIVWRCVFLDEAHKMKNDLSLISRAVGKIQSQHMMMLTGTPIQNNLRELFALLSLLCPDIFSDGELFENAFDLTARKVDDDKLAAAHFLLRQFSLRRVKDEVDIFLPPMAEIKVCCPLTSMQTFLYRALLIRQGPVLAELERDAEKNGAIKFKPNSEALKSLQNVFSQLRKVTDHPYMLPEVVQEFDGSSTDEGIVDSSGKMLVLDRMLHKLLRRGHRVVVFSQYNGFLDIIEDYTRMRGYSYRRLDGKTNRIQRMIDIEQYNKLNSDIFIYLLNTKAGGEGVNLQTADTCILMDSNFNPQVDRQAMARVHRIGQFKPVQIYRFVSDGTVEERVLRRAESKLYLDNSVNRGSTAAALEMEGMGKRELLSMLKFGADRVFKNDSGEMPSDADLDAIIDRSKMVCVTAKAAPVAGTSSSTTHSSAPAAATTISATAAAAAAAGAALPGAVDNTASRCDASTSAVGVVLASTSAGVAPQDAAAMKLVTCKHTVLDFNVQQVPESTFIFGGMDYTEVRLQACKEGLKQIAQEFKQKRERKECLVKIDGYDILKVNNYSMQEGGISIGIKTIKKKGSRQIGGRDFQNCDYCQVCWDGGSEVVCCDICPASYHLECLELKDVPKKWACPHHKCSVCGRNTTDAGGLLFRCDTCSDAFCEDHVPVGYKMVGENELFKALGQIHPKNACYVTCTDTCKAVKAENDAYFAKAAAKGTVVSGQGAQPHTAGPTKPEAERMKGEGKPAVAARQSTAQGKAGVAEQQRGPLQGGQTSADAPKGNKRSADQGSLSHQGKVAKVPGGPIAPPLPGKAGQEDQQGAKAAAAGAGDPVAAAGSGQMVPLARPRTNRALSTRSNKPA